jgi:hypothetical protein
MKPERETDVCIGTGQGRNLMGQKAIVEIIAEAFRRRGVKHITVDKPFSGTGPNTVSSTVAGAAACRPSSWNSTPGF